VRAALKQSAPDAPVWVAAVGKAAIAMAHGAYQALGTALERTLIITRDTHGRDALPPAMAPEVWVGSHPVPDERSLAAGQRLLAWVEELPPHAHPLFLISGGSSALVEVLQPGATLADLEALTRAALAADVAIGEFNARRTAISRIKGGRLAARLRGRAAQALSMSVKSVEIASMPTRTWMVPAKFCRKIESIAAIRLGRTIVGTTTATAAGRCNSAPGSA